MPSHERRWELIVELCRYRFGKGPTRHQYANVIGDCPGDLGGPHMIGVPGDPVLIEYQDETHIDKLHCTADVCR